ncbi:unnamed protein product [Prunus armeniaca]
MGSFDPNDFTATISLCHGGKVIGDGGLQVGSAGLGLKEAATPKGEGVLLINQGDSQPPTHPNEMGWIKSISFSIDLGRNEAKFNHGKGAMGHRRRETLGGGVMGLGFWFFFPSIS